MLSINVLCPLHLRKTTVSFKNQNDYHFGTLQNLQMTYFFASGYNFNLSDHLNVNLFY